MQKILDYLQKFKPFAILGDQITDPIKFRRLNGWLVVFWTVMFPVSIITGLWTIVAFISVLSIYANWATHLGVWTSSRAEVAATVDVEEVDIEAKHASVKANGVDVEQK